MQIRRLRWALTASFALACDAPRTDPEIERSVALELASETSLRSHAIDVTSIGGKVQLLGRVSSEAQSLRAEALAEPVRGVHFVQNQLVVATARGRARSSALGRPGRPIVSMGP